MVMLFEGELMMMLREAERAPVQTECSVQSTGRANRSRPSCSRRASKPQFA